MGLRLPDAPKLNCTSGRHCGKDRQADVISVVSLDLVEHSPNELSVIAQGGLIAKHIGAELRAPDLPD